jgi:hypothetical protein
VPSYEELRAQPPIGADDEEGLPKLLGVPEGYAVERPAQPSTARRAVRPEMTPAPERMPVQIPARFREGEQYRPGSLPPEAIVQLQHALDAAGLFKKGERYVLGRWDDTTISAYTRLLRFGNQQGHQDPASALRALGTLSPEERDELGLGGVGGGPGGERAPLVVSVDSPEDLKTIANRVARSVSGTAMTDEQLERFVASYHQAQTAYQAQVYAARETGGAITEVPEPGTVAEAQVRQARPTESFGHDLLNSYQKALELFGVQSRIATPTSGGGL